MRKKRKSSAEYQWDLDCPLAYLCPYEETDQLSLNLIVVLSARFFPMGNVNTPICFVWPETNMVQSLTLYAFFFFFSFWMFHVYKNSQSFDMKQAKSFFKILVYPSKS